MEAVGILLFLCFVELVATVYCLTRLRGLLMQVKDVSSLVSSINRMLDDKSDSEPSPSPEVDKEKLDAAVNLLSSLGIDVEPKE